MSVQCHLPESTCGGAVNAIFMVENRNVHLANGQARTPAAPGSAATITTEIYGQPVCGDLNGDGRDDAALVLVQESGGSGSFYYVAAAIAENGIYRGTNAILFSDFF